MHGVVNSTFPHLTLAWHAAPKWQLDNHKQPQQEHLFALEIGQMAVRSLHAELTLYPKPGLVSLVDNGSHDDMTSETFMRSLFSLRHYFVRIAKAGSAGAPFATLKSLAITAEQRMLMATAGVNTHRGAIFSIGLLCAAIGYARTQQMVLSNQNIRSILQLHWGDALAVHMQHEENKSHGFLVSTQHAASGAREEAALGFPSVFEVALPALNKTLADGRSWYMAKIDTLFALMAHISDTNVYFRGGPAGARTVKNHAQAFVKLGGTAHPEWKIHALECHKVFTAQRLSPGGAADLLAATCLLHQMAQFSNSRE